MRDPVSSAAADSSRSALISPKHRVLGATVVDASSARTKATTDAWRAYADNKAKAQKSSGIFKK